MYFVTLELTDDGEVKGSAKGHATEVVEQFHKVADLLLSSRGPWRITFVNGVAPTEAELDSDMVWQLSAVSKDRGV